MVWIVVTWLSSQQFVKLYTLIIYLKYPHAPLRERFRSCKVMPIFIFKVSLPGRMVLGGIWLLKVNSFRITASPTPFIVFAILTFLLIDQICISSTSLIQTIFTTFYPPPPSFVCYPTFSSQKFLVLSEFVIYSECLIKAELIIFE